MLISKYIKHLVCQLEKRQLNRIAINLSLGLVMIFPVQSSNHGAFVHCNNAFVIDLGILDTHHGQLEQYR